MIKNFLYLGLALATPVLQADEAKSEKLKSFEAVKSIFQSRCLSCHNDASKLRYGGNLSLETKESILKGGFRGPSMKEGDAKNSNLYISVTLKEGEFGPVPAMPPIEAVRKLPRLNDKDIKAIHDWIQLGAYWPEGEKIAYQIKKVEAGKMDPVELAQVQKIHAKIVANAENNEKESYSVSLEGSRDSLDMKLIPAGELEVKDESGSFTAKLDGFWMSDKEMSWETYELFMVPEITRNKDGYPVEVDQIEEGSLVLAQPSPAYHGMSFGMPVRKRPAIAMTQHAANKFCQWLSWKTGHFYRLPTEAEWEYAARAGAKTAYPWGAEANKDEADTYAWFDENSDGAYARRGKKEPNAWGLYDMHGNVMEWTLDAYVKDRKAYFGNKEVVENPWVKATKPYPHVCKGGHWNEGVELLSYSSRVPSNASWKETDPQSPKSIWYHTDIQWIGFRVIRTEKIPTVEEMYQYWNSGVQYDD